MTDEQHDLVAYVDEQYGKIGLWKIVEKAVDNPPFAIDLTASGRRWLASRIFVSEATARELMTRFVAERSKRIAATLEAEGLKIGGYGT